MWNNEKLLNGMARGLYCVAALIGAYLGLCAVLNAAAFPLRTVRVEGDFAHITGEDIRARLAARVAGNFFGVDLDAVRTTLEDFPWARKVEVRRRWPDGMAILIEEHRPLARWGERLLVNTYGEVFSAQSDDELPMFGGPPGTEKEITAQYAALRALVAPLGAELTQVLLSPRHAWQIKLSLPQRPALVVELGREQPRAAIAERLARFVAAYPRTLGEFQPAMAARIQHVDLRYANGFTLRVPGFGSTPQIEPNRTKGNARSA